MQEGNADFHWPMYDVTHRYHAIIRARPSVGRDYRRQRADFWQNVVEQLVLNGAAHQQQRPQQLVSKL
jgi:hypothetical protein